MINESSITDKFEIAEGFNSYFLKLVFRPIITCPNIINILQNICPDITYRAFFLNTVAPSDVLLTTYNLKRKLSQGYDGISTKLL